MLSAGIKIIKQIFQLPLQPHSSPLTKLVTEPERQQFAETKQHWFLPGRFNVETVPVLGVKKTTLVFRAATQNTALASDEKPTTPNWNHG